MRRIMPALVALMVVGLLAVGCAGALYLGIPQRLMERFAPQQDLRELPEREEINRICEKAFASVEGETTITLENQQFNSWGLQGSYSLSVRVEKYLAKLGYNCNDIMFEVKSDERGRYVVGTVNAPPRLLSMDISPIDFQRDIQIHTDSGMAMDFLQWVGAIPDDETLKNDIQLRVRDQLLARICANQAAFDEARLNMQEQEQDVFALMGAYGWLREEVVWSVPDTGTNICDDPLR